MAIVINGSGTVTGISVGGLPDDIVDSGTLADDAVVAAAIATNAVTTAKINADAVTAAKIGDDVIDSEHYAAGSIDTAHIGTDQITSAILPTGSILQVVTATTTTASETSNTSFTASGLAASITPSSTSSKVFIIASFPIETHGAPANAIGVYTLYHDQTTNLGHSTEGFGKQSGTNESAPYYHSRGIGSINYVHSPGSVAEADYEVYHMTKNGSCGSKVAGTAKASITLMEIAG